MKRGSGACNAPRLNARRLEEKVVGKIRENVLTESNIRALVNLVDEEMDGVAREQRQKLETIEAELVDVKRRLGRLYDLAETTDLDIDDFKPRISPNPPMWSGLGVGTRGEGRGTRRSELDSDKWVRWRPLVVVGGADGGPGQRRWGGVGGTACRGRQSRTGPVRLCGAVG